MQHQWIIGQRTDTLVMIIKGFAIHCINLPFHDSGQIDFSKFVPDFVSSRPQIRQFLLERS